MIPSLCRLHMLRSPPSDWNDLNRPEESCGVCGLCHRLCSMNIWCRVHDVSGALKRNVYSLQMPVFLWVALITEQIGETQTWGGRPRPPPNTWQRLPHGGGDDSGLLNISLSALSLPFVFAVPLCDSSFLLTGWRGCCTPAGTVSMKYF